jgi:hypothetical protein
MNGGDSLKSKCFCLPTEILVLFHRQFILDSLYVDNGFVRVF